MEVVIDRKPIEGRIICWCVIGIICVGLIAFFLHSTEMGIGMSIPFGFSLLLWGAFLAYMSLWQMKLTPTKLIYRRFFFKHIYPYAEIKEILIYNNGYFGKRLWIDFKSGKRITIQDNFTNYAKALTVLRRHHPIQQIPDD